MLTVAETPSFTRLWRDYWTEDELLERDAGRDIGAELLESLREMKSDEAAAIHDPVAIARYRVRKINLTASRSGRQDACAYVDPV